MHSFLKISVQATMNCLLVCALLPSITACVFEPVPEPIAAAPPPPGYAQPCCYAYPEYPPYYYAPAYGGYYAGPPVTFGVGIGGGGYHHWR